MDKQIMKAKELGAKARVELEKDLVGAYTYKHIKIDGKWIARK